MKDSVLRSLSRSLMLVGAVLAANWAVAGPVEHSAIQEDGAGAVSAAAGLYEPWKAPFRQTQLGVGLMAGMGELDGSIGFQTIGTLAALIAPEGWIPDINNQVFAEAQLGHLWVDGGSAFYYSLHLRWDFWRDQNWGFYSLAGLGGLITSEHLGDRFRLFPRFGAGVFYSISDFIDLRGELSRENIAVGFVYRL